MLATNTCICDMMLSSAQHYRRLEFWRWKGLALRVVPRSDHKDYDSFLVNYQKSFYT